MLDKDRTSLEGLAFFSPFFGGEVVLVGKVLEVKVFVNASPFLGKLAHPTRPEQSFEQLARFLQVIALNTATFLDRVLQVLLPIFLRRFSHRKTWRLEL